MSRILQPSLAWTRHPDPAIAEEWEGTPYESGQRVKKVAADCIGSVFGVIDDLDGQNRASLPGLPADAAMHSRDTAVAAVRELIRRYEPNRKLRLGRNGDVRVRPGDIVVTGYKGGGPGHVEIVGARRNELWHSLEDGAGFAQRGWGFLESQVLYGVWRAEDQWRWVR